MYPQFPIMNLAVDSEERNLIRQKYRKLVTECHAFLNKENTGTLRQAFTMMLEVHGRKLLDNREPYFCHAVDVACIVAGEMGLGFVSVVASLLNGIPPAEVNVQEFYRKNKLDEARIIIDSLKRIKELPTERLTGNAENFISLLLSLSSDVRVVLLQLADRLQYMRAISSLSEPLQKLVSAETSNLYAPLAHRLGLYRIKSELDELSLQYSNPAVYEDIESRIRKAETKDRDFLNSFLEPVTAELNRLGLDFIIKKRTKAVSSVYAKIVKQEVSFEEVYDLFAIRIILNSAAANEKADCWKAYSAVTNIYTPEPKRLRDWITIPRPNGYESLHITVLGPAKRWVEVQIRTRRMDEEAELGNAAHWRYKGQRGAVETGEWLSSIRKILENPLEADAELSKGQKPASSSDMIYVFTPEGDLKKLKAGSTVLDFAFEVHTNIGSKCSGGKVNNKIVPIRHRLKSGDMVEIITSKNQNPNIDWLGWVATSRAKNKIKRYLKEAEFKQAEAGKEIFRRKLTQLKISNPDEAINKLVAHFKLSGPLDLYQQLAEDRIEPSQLKEILIVSPKETKDSDEKTEPRLPAKSESRAPNRTSENVIIVNESSEIEGYKLARCCNPVMGDEIFGFITVGDGIKIHRTTCPNAARMKSRYPYRTMEAQWSTPAEGTYFLATIKISGFDQLGILNTITTMISNELKMDVRTISLDSKGGRFDGIIKVSIRDKKHLEFLLKKLLTIKGIIKASRLSTSS